MPKKTLPLSFRQKLGFGILDLAGNAIFTIVSFWLLNFLTDTLRLRPELAGTALLLGRVWDAVTDPLMGWISDRTRTRWGRRRPYLLAGGITTAASLVILFLPVHSSNQILLFFWAAGSYSLLCTASTVLLVPYFALTPELTKDYRERSVLNGFRMTSAVVGTLLGAGAFLPLLSLFPDRNTAWPFTAAIFGLITVALSLVTFCSVKEPVLPRGKQDDRNLWKNIKDVFRNRTFLLLVIPWTLNIAAVTIVSGMFIYYFQHVLARPELTTPGLLILLLTTFVFIPLWVLAGKRWSKHGVYAAGMAILGVACCLIFFLGRTPQIVMGLLVIAGIGLAGAYAAPGALIPDVVEEDAVRKGRRREGIYYGIWTFSSKTGQAIASLMMGWGLALSGYSAAAAKQTASTLEGIRWMAGPLPAVILFTAAIILYWYPLKKEKFDKMMEQSSAK